jgi:sugar phosphate isomerase/epimerase
MARAVTLFTGQWADLTLDVLAGKAASFGFDGLELACWGDHFDVEQALSSDGYYKSRRDIASPSAHTSSGSAWRMR